MDFSVGGGGKNHQIKPNLFMTLWVVFLDTDLKMDAPH